MTNRDLSKDIRGAPFTDFSPAAGLETLGPDRFRAAGSYAKFLLSIRDGRFPSGPAKISFELAETALPAQAVLCIETEDQPLTEIYLPESANGRFHTIVLFPPRIVSIRLELRNQFEFFTLRNPKIREIKAWEYLVARSSNWQTLKRALKYGLRYGLSATLLKAFTASRHQGFDPYREWIGRNDTLTRADRRAIRRQIRTFPQRPLISILLPVYDPQPKFLRLCLESISAQLYPNWELCVADDASRNPDIWAMLKKFAARDRRVKIVHRPQNGNISAASNSALALVTGAYTALLDHDDVLAPHALYMVAVELSQYPDADLIYSDEDKIDAAGNRYGPHFKSDWNYDLFTSANMISHLGVYRTALLREVGGFREGFEGSQDYDLALRVIEKSSPERIRHIPFVLYHWRVFESSGSFSSSRLETATNAARRALTEHLQRRGEIGEVVDGGTGETHRIRRPLPVPAPLVSILVPTRDRLPLLRVCIDGLLHKTDYPDLEIIILDNESREDETRDYLNTMTADPRIRVERCDGAFNFSALNNRGAAIARGSVLALLNNDIEIMEPDWLGEMVAHALRPNVGAVGAKLLYPDDTIQHAGVVMGIGGIAGHAFKHCAADDVGYFRRAKLTQNYAAVTGACMVLRKACYDEVGGLDADALKVAYNDVDLCLRLRRAGYDIVWTPYAVLRHHESVSRGAETDPENSVRFAGEIETMRRRWAAAIANDPFYNPNLGLLTEDFRLAETPRVTRPWQID